MIIPDNCFHPLLHGSLPHLSRCVGVWGTHVNVTYEGCAHCDKGGMRMISYAGYHDHTDPLLFKDSNIENDHVESEEQFVARREHVPDRRRGL